MATETPPAEGAVEQEAGLLTIDGVECAPVFHPDRQTYLEADPFEGYEKLDIEIGPKSMEMLKVRVEGIVDRNNLGATVIWSQKQGEVWVATDELQGLYRKQGYAQKEAGFERYTVRYYRPVHGNPECREVQKDFHQSYEIEQAESFDLLSEPYPTGNSGYSPEIGNTVVGMITSWMRHTGTKHTYRHDFDEHGSLTATDGDFGITLPSHPDTYWVALRCKPTEALAKAIGHNCRLFQNNLSLIEGGRATQDNEVILVPFKVDVG